MPMRVTTGMTMSTYRYNLMKSNNNVVNSQNKVLTHRNFNSYAEDPAAATHAWRIRRAFAKNSAYISNNSDTLGRFRIAYAAMDKVKTDMANNTALKDAITGNTDTTASGRQALARVIRQGAESVVQDMNGAKYGDHFVFGGKDALNVPFSWSDDMSTLYYRGVNVDAGGVEPPLAPEPTEMATAIEDIKNKEKPKEEDFPGDTAGYETAVKDWENEQAWASYYNHETSKQPETGNVPQSLKDALDKVEADAKNETGEAQRIAQEWGRYYRHESNTKPMATEPTWAAEKDEYGYPVGENVPNIYDATGIDKEWLDYYKDHSDFNRLEAMANEETNVDLGLGLQENEDGEIINGSVFNMALPGIKMIGYGVDEDGDPRNLATLMKKYAAVLERTDPETGAFADGDREIADRLLNKINSVNNDVIGSYSDDVAAQAEFLETNGERLKEQGYALDEERAAIEDIDPADAITDFLYNYTCYNAALKVGTQLLSQSLIDYMN